MDQEGKKMKKGKKAVVIDEYGKREIAMPRASRKTKQRNRALVDHWRESLT